MGLHGWLQKGGDRMASMAEQAERLLGWPDLLARGEQEQGEIVGGRLYAMSPRPAPRHGFVQLMLSHALAGPFVREDGAGPGGWWILVEPDVTLGPHDVVSPDLVGWRRDRVPEFPHDRPIAARPDWVCEILSPSTLRLDRVVKADLYLRAGIPHYWMVDPEARLIEAFAAEKGRWVRLGGHAGADSVRVLPFDAVELVVDELFPPPPGSGLEATGE